MQRPGTAVEKPNSHTQGQGEDSCHGPQTILRKQRKSLDVVKIEKDLEGAEKEGWLRWLQKNKTKKTKKTTTPLDDQRNESYSQFRVPGLSKSEAKQLRMCLLSKRAVILRQKSKAKKSKVSRNGASPPSPTPHVNITRTSTQAPLSLRAPVVVCLLCRSSQSVSKTACVGLLHQRGHPSTLLFECPRLAQLSLSNLAQSSNLLCS